MDKERTEVAALFYLSVVWSVGTLIDQNERPKFNHFIKEQLEKLFENGNYSKEIVPPKELSIYEIYFDHEKKNWNLWNSKLDFNIPKDT